MPVRPGKVEEFDLDHLIRCQKEADKPLLLDVRNNDLFTLGHIPNAINMPRERFQMSFSENSELLEQYRNKQIIVYCSGRHCEDARIVGNVLKEMDFERIAVFIGGWEDWNRLGLPSSITPLVGMGSWLWMRNKSINKQQ